MAEATAATTLLGILGLIALIVLAYAAGLATRPWVDEAADRLRARTADGRVVQREALEALQRSLSELQRIAEAINEPGADRRFTEADERVTEARDQLASRGLRKKIARFQADAHKLAAFHREEAARPPLLDESGEVSGPKVLGRMFSAMSARQDALQSLAAALSGVSEELLRR